MTEIKNKPNIYESTNTPYIQGLLDQVDITYQSALDRNSNFSYENLNNPQSDNLLEQIRRYVFLNAYWDISNSNEPQDRILLDELFSFLKTNYPEEFSNQAQATMSRRDVLKAFAGLFMTQAITTSNVLIHPDSLSLNETASTPEPTNAHSTSESTVEKENHKEHAHNPDHISKADLITASMITALFGSTLGTQAAAGLVEDGRINKTVLKTLFGTEDQSKAELSGWTAKNLTIAWMMRVSYLYMDSQYNDNEEESIASKHAYEHEINELPNIAVAAGLVAASEVTSNLYYESRSAYQKSALEALDAFSKNQAFQINGRSVTRADFEAFWEVNKPEVEAKYAEAETKRELIRLALEDIKAFLDAEKTEESIDVIEAKYKKLSIEDIDGHISQIKQGLADDIMLNSSLSVLTAPISLTFTTASLVNKRLKPIAINTTKLHYLEELRKAKIENMAVGKEEFTEMWEVANKKTLDDMNGPMGLVNLSITIAANVAGVAFFGDPPNIFFIKDHGWKEWGWNSLEGLAYSITFSTLSHNGYIMKKLGQDVNFYKANLDSVVASSQILSNTIYHLSTEQIRRLLIKLDPAGNLIKSWSPKDYNRGHLSFDYDSFFNEVIGKAKEMVYGDFFEERIHQIVDKFSQMFSSTNKLTDTEESRHRVILEMLSNIGVPETKEDESEATNQNILDTILKEVDTETRRFIETELKNRINGIVTKIDSIPKEDIEEEGIGFITDEIMDDDFFASLPPEVSESIIELIKDNLNNKIKNTEHQEKHKHLLSHSARDVRNALFTQLWAVGALQTVAKKALGLDSPEKISVDKAKIYTTTILAIIAGTSAVADNVAAMLFGINVLDKIGKKTLGEKYDENSELAIKLRRYAFIMSVFAGSLSKIGNGPNMSIEKIASVFRDSGKEIIEVKSMANMLGPSFANVWSGMAVSLLLAIGSAVIYSKIDNSTSNESNN